MTNNFLCFSNILKFQKMFFILSISFIFIRHYYLQNLIELENITNKIIEDLTNSKKNSKWSKCSSNKNFVNIDWLMMFSHHSLKFIQIDETKNRSIIQKFVINRYLVIKKFCRKTRIKSKNLRIRHRRSYWKIHSNSKNRINVSQSSKKKFQINNRFQINRKTWLLFTIKSTLFSKSQFEMKQKWWLTFVIIRTYDF